MKRLTYTAAMLHTMVKEHIEGLSDPELIEYVLSGTELYEPDAECGTIVVAQLAAISRPDGGAANASD